MHIIYGGCVKWPHHEERGSLTYCSKKKDINYDQNVIEDDRYIVRRLIDAEGDGEQKLRSDCNKGKNSWKRT